ASAQTTATATTGTATPVTGTTATLTTVPATSTLTSPTIIVNQAGGANIVGGVMVNVDGVLSHQDEQDRAKVLEARRKALAAVPGDMNQPTQLRMISLKKLEATIEQYAKDKQPLPDDVKYLAGLERVQYVFVYPEQHDVVLAGPAGGWKLNENGDVVGSTTGRPVLQLDDLLVALRYADAARNGGISCSIDPTPGGLQRLQMFLDQHRGPVGQDPKPILEAIQQSLGPQRVTVNGVPNDSRFASVLVAADFQMKRIGMGFEPSLVKGLPSYLEMVPTNSKVANALPRWWMAPKYDPLATDGQGLAWEIKGPGVMCMAEEDFFNSLGQREKTVKANPTSQKWADLMTEHFGDLEQKYSIFGDLHNCIDLAVVGALIVKENLLEKADLQLPFLTDPRTLGTSRYYAPEHVDSKASYLRKGGSYVISASGGVNFQPWDIVQKTTTSASLDPTRTEAEKARTSRWWWNGSPSKG
ncbi:MAG TPA: DUF1598 domain-containing protein, partial [Pirellulales bacterium]